MESLPVIAGERGLDSPPPGPPPELPNPNAAGGRPLFRHLQQVAWWVGYPVRFARHHPVTASVLVLLLLTGAAIGVREYALRQWQAAQAALKDDRLAEAKDRLDFCLRVWPRSPEVHLLAARVARLSADSAAAEAYLNRCLELQGGATEAVQLEFLLVRLQGADADETMPALIDLVEKNHPQTPAILETLARYYMHRLRYKEAYACLSRWIEGYPDSAKPYHWRGWVLERLNNHKRAMQDYLQALELKPGLTRVRLRVAEMLLEEKRPLDALPHLEQLISQLPDSPEVQARLGQCRFLQGQMEEARRLLEAAAPHLPKDPALLLHLAKLELQEGRVTEAEHWARRVLQLDSTDMEAHYTLASVLQFQGRSVEAAVELKEYERSKALVERLNTLLKEEAEHPTQRPDAPAEIGTILLGVGQGQEQLAVYWLELALERDPRHQPAHKALAEYYEKKGDTAQAASHRRMVRESPTPSSGTGSARP